MDSVPSGANTGTPGFTVFLSVSSIARSNGGGGTTGPLRYFKVTTADPHRLQDFGFDTVSIWGANLTGSFDNPFNGAFRVERVLSSTEFLCTLDVDPGVNPSGAIMWTSQNSTPL